MVNPPNRVRKSDIKFKIVLTEEQKAVKTGIYEKDISIILGNFGSGKTQVACNAALDMLFKKQITKIFITRPVNFESTGFLKGDINEKMSFHVFPIKQNMYDAYGKEKIDELFKEGDIQIIPIDYMKGITVTNGFMIVDEFQDIKYDDFELIVTRLGVDSKLVFTGSEQQIGIAHSCMNKIKCLEKCPTVNFATLQSFHRNPDIITVLNFIKENA
jgi:phosphate starvation-inducible protein PhoH